MIPICIEILPYYILLFIKNCIDKEAIFDFWRLQYFEKVNLIPADLVDAGSIVEAIKISKPDEIYHLATQSFVSASFKQPIGTGDITRLEVIRILEVMKQVNPDIKFYRASTSKLYGRGNRAFGLE